MRFALDPEGRPPLRITLEPGARPDFAKLHDGQLIRLTLGKDGQYIEHLGT